MKGRAVVVALAVVAVAGLAVWLLLTKPGPSHGWSEPSAELEAKVAGLEKWKRGRSVRGAIARREVSDAVNFKEEWTLDDLTPRIHEAAEDAERLTAKLNSSEPGWAGYYNAITDPFFMGDVVEACGPNYVAAEPCYISVNLVTEAVDSDSGPRSVVKYAAVSGAEPLTPECRHYASCVGRGFLGRELPEIPGGSEAEGTLATWGLPSWDEDRIQVNPKKIDACIAEAVEQLQALDDGKLPAERAHMFDYLYEKFDARKAWCEQLKADLE